MGQDITVITAYTQTHTHNGSYVRGEERRGENGGVNLTVLNILQYICVSNHHVYTLILHMLYDNISVKLEKCTIMNVYSTF